MAQGQQATVWHNEGLVMQQYIADAAVVQNGDATVWHSGCPTTHWFLAT